MVQKVSRDIGLLSSSNCPCAFGHASRYLEMVHGDDFIIAGSGDDLDWLSQKLNGKLKLAQKARLGPGHDREATVLNRCVTHSDSGLTWEADRRDAELAVVELGLQAARPQASRTHHWTTKSGNLTGRKPTTACRQDQRTWQQTDLTLHPLAKSTVEQLGKQRGQISHV